MLSLSEPQQAAPDEVQRRETARRYTLVTVPTIRLLGVNAVIVAALLHHMLIGAAVSHAALAAFALTMELYALGSWAALWATREQIDRRAHLQSLLVLCDIAVCVAATYVTGAERSLLFFLIALRLADSSIAFPRSLVLAHLAPLSYGALLSYVHTFHQHDVSLGQAVVNTFTLYGISLYFAVIGRTAGGLRAKLADAARTRAELLIELRQKNASLEIAMLRAGEGARAKERFLATVSHELRTPLTAVIAQTEMVVEEADPSKHPQMIADLRQVISSARELSGVIDNILEVSATGVEGPRTSAQGFTLTALFADLRATMELTMTANSNKLVINTDRAPRQIVADRTRVREILMILLQNAAKFTCRGTVTLTARTATGHFSSVAFTVSDTGVGIPDAVRNSLFTPFSQADASSTRAFGGAGLGLVIAKRHADAISADLSYETAPGGGASFTLVVPTKLVAPHGTKVAELPPFQSGAA